MTLSRIFTIELVWVTLVFAAVVAAAGVLPVGPWDFWWHAAVGQEILTTGTIPTTDHFSYTMPGSHFHYQSWLAEIVLALVLGAGGPAGAVWLRVLVLLCTFAMLLALCWQAGKGNVRLAVLATATAVIGGATNWAVRPQLLSYPLFVAELVLLWRWRQAPEHTPLWLLPLLVGLWANVHGAFILGLVLPGLLLVGEGLASRRLTPNLQRLAVWTFLAAVATLLNPRGPAIIGYVWTLLTNAPSQTTISEWRPPSLAQADGQLFFGLLALGALVLLWRWRELAWSDLLWWLAFAFLASRGLRYVIWFVMIQAPILARALAGVQLSLGRHSAPPPRRPGWINGLLMGMLLLLALSATPWFKDAWPLPPALRGLVTPDTPVAAVAVLDRDPPRRLFHSMGHGSYLIWRWRGTPPVFIDPRVELYPLALWQDYGAVTQASPGWQAILDRWEVDTLLLDREREAPLVAAAAAAGWREQWGDEYTVIFRR